MEPPVENSHTTFSCAPDVATNLEWYSDETDVCGPTQLTQRIKMVPPVDDLDADGDTDSDTDSDTDAVAYPDPFSVFDTDDTDAEEFSDESSDVGPSTSLLSKRRKMELPEVDFLDLRSDADTDDPGYEFRYLSNHSNRPISISNDASSPQSADLSEGSPSGRHPKKHRHVAVTTFEKHKDIIVSCSLHPHLSWAVTASQYYHIYVWHVLTGDLLFEKVHHKRNGNSDVRFSDDGHYLATGNHTGKLCVYKIKANVEREEMFCDLMERSLENISWMCWYRGVNRLIVAGESNHILIYYMPSGVCKILPIPNKQSCNLAVLTNDNQKLFTVEGNNSLRLWDLNSRTVIMKVNKYTSEVAHQQKIVAVTCDAESRMFVSGDVDGKILFCNKHGPVECQKEENGIICLVAAPSREYKLIACGTGLGVIRVWDHTKSIISLTTFYVDNNTITDMKWISNYDLAATTSGGKIFGFDACSGTLKFSICAHMRHINQIQYDRRMQIVLTVSEDKKAKIFSLPITKHLKHSENALKRNE